MGAFAKFIAALSAITARAEGLTASLPRPEQYENQPEVKAGVNGINGLATSIKASLTEFTAREEEFRTGFAAEAKAALIAGGEYILKADHTAAVQVAVNAEAERMRTEFTNLGKQAALILERRGLAVTAHKLPKLVVDRMPDAEFLADTFATNFAKVLERLTKFIPFGITAEKGGEVLADVGAIPTDAAGDAIFNSRLSLITATVTATRGTTAAPNPPNPMLNGGNSSAAADVDSEKVFEKGGREFRGALV